MASADLLLGGNGDDVVVRRSIHGMGDDSFSSGNPSGVIEEFAGNWGRICQAAQGALHQHLRKREEDRSRDVSSVVGRRGHLQGLF
jgi:hypothetical protein